jgi:hypothetical protein
MKRKENESFIAYQKRRIIENNVIKERQKVRLVWDSREGHYVRAIHGPLI